jgi:transcriptional regulator with XRE-family HTH domain
MDFRELSTIKKRLRGKALRKLMEEKGTNKFQVSKATGVSYRTLCNWEHLGMIPSTRLALLVGAHLGLFSPREVEINSIRKAIEEAQDRLHRLQGSF